VTVLVFNMVHDIETYFENDPVSNPYPENKSILYTEVQLGKSRFASRFVSDNHTLADVSCGSGYNSQLIPHKRYIGVDHPAMMDKIVSLGIYSADDHSFVGCDLQTDDLKLEKKVDRIVSFETIEHLDEPNKFLVNLRNNLKSNGLLILSTPNNPFGGEPKFYEHVKEYSSQELSEMTHDAGFRILRSYVQGVPFGLVSYIINKLGVRPQRYNPSDDRNPLAVKVDRIRPFRKTYCQIIPYEILGDTGACQLVIATPN